MEITGSLIKSTKKDQTTGGLRARLPLGLIGRILLNVAYTLAGFGVLIGFWQIISIVTEGELPKPLATFEVFWDLVRDPFYDLGPNDKGIALQLGSSLVRVFTGFLIGSFIAIPIGLLM